VSGQPAGSETVLVAGVGNVFLGDDGFGIEVVRRLARREVPAGVAVADYGIRGLHLAYDLLDGRFETLILVDAVPVDTPPGTVVVLEVDPEAAEPASGAGGGAEAVPDAHGMDPATVLKLLRSLGGTGPGYVERIYVVGVRPVCLEAGMSLSDPVADAVDQAVQAVLDLLDGAAAPSRRPDRTGADWRPEASWTSSNC
jgi:hydrogenase maturation protease